MCMSRPHSPHTAITGFGSVGLLLSPSGGSFGMIGMPRWSLAFKACLQIQTRLVVVAVFVLAVFERGNGDFSH